MSVARTIEGMTRPRTVEIGPFPPERKVVLGALRAGRVQAPVYGLVQLDVTEATGQLAGMEPKGSFTAYIVACVARAVAAQPEVAAYRDWRGRIVTHRHVDVAAMIEVETHDRKFPLAHVVRDADVRTVADISAELAAVKEHPESSRSGALLHRIAPAIARIPGVVRLFYAALARSPRMRRKAGTVSVTSVGMFAGGSGLGIGAPTTMTLSVLVGGISSRPWVVDGQIVVRELVDLTIAVDHRIVDGGPIARFSCDLRSMIEAGGLMAAPSESGTG